MSRLAACMAGILVAGAAHGAPFADPTRPPGAARAGDAAPAAGPRLESVLIAPDRRIAVINGQQVGLGAAYGDGVVVRISETEVVIAQGAGRATTLKLFPEVEKRHSGAARGEE